MPELHLRWAFLSSWHALEADHFRTICGINLEDQDPVTTRDEPPAITERSCENCLRIMAERVDVPA